MMFTAAFYVGATRLIDTFIIEDWVSRFTQAGTYAVSAVCFMYACAEQAVVNIDGFTVGGCCSATVCTFLM